MPYQNPLPMPLRLGIHRALLVAETASLVFLVTK
jgi:hypothetical protein